MKVIFSILLFIFPLIVVANTSAFEQAAGFSAKYVKYFLITIYALVCSTTYFIFRSALIKELKNKNLMEREIKRRLFIQKVRLGLLFFMPVIVFEALA